MNYEPSSIYVHRTKKLYESKQRDVLKVPLPLPPSLSSLSLSRRALRFPSTERKKEPTIRRNMCHPTVIGRITYVVCITMYTVTRSNYR